MLRLCRLLIRMLVSRSVYCLLGLRLGLNIVMEVLIVCGVSFCSSVVSLIVLILLVLGLFIVGMIVGLSILMLIWS